MSDTVKTLPVFQTVGDSIKYTIRNIGLMINLVWFWGALIAAVSAVVFLAGGSEILKLIFFGVENPNAVWSGSDFLFFCAVFLLYMIASYSVVVGWHRALLLDERPGAMHASLGKRELSYFLRTLAMIFGFALPIGLFIGLLGALAATTGGGSSEPGGPMAAVGIVGVIGGLVGFVALVLLAVRLVLVLPGAAVGDRRVSFRASFTLTKGNSWRIFGGFCLIAIFQIAVFLVLALVILLVSGGGTQGWMAFLTQSAETGEVVPGFIVFSIFQFLFSLVFTFFALSYMSYCYWFFVPPPGQGDLA